MLEEQKKRKLIDEINDFKSSFSAIGYVNFVEFYFEWLHRVNDENYIYYF
jgi:hypothetical protein